MSLALPLTGSRTAKAAVTAALALWSPLGKAAPSVSSRTAAAMDPIVPAVKAPHAPHVGGHETIRDWADAARISGQRATYRIEYDDQEIYLRGDFDISCSRVDVSINSREVGPFLADRGVLWHATPRSFSARVPWPVVGALPEEGALIPVAIRAGDERTSFSWSGFAEVPKPKRSLTLIPYALAGSVEGSKPLFDTGIDAKSRYRGLDLLASVNPDFRTIERDILSLDFSYFERLPAETRPFFLSGTPYYNAASFASQRIDTFDLGEKAYGNLDDKTRLGLFDGATFFSQNYLVGSLSHQLDPNGVLSAGFKSFHDAGLANEFISAGLNYKLGDFRLLSGLQLTRDNEVGGGDSKSAALVYGRNGFFGRLGGIETAPDFLDRLGYYTEPDIKGFDASIGKAQSFKKGELANASVNLFTSQYHYLNDDAYRQYYGGGAAVSLRTGQDLSFNFLSGTFLANKDHTEEFIASTPGRYASDRIGIDFTTGQLASSDYTSALFFASLRPTPHLRIRGSIQTLHQYEDQEQLIVHVEYDLGGGQSLGGRLWQLGHDWTGYVRYRRALARGGELEVLFGDPNTPRFERSLVLKLVLPMEIRF